LLCLPGPRVDQKIIAKEFSETVDAETARLKEKLVFEYVSYGNPSYDIAVYLLNCGTIDDVEIKRVYIANDTWLQTSQVRFCIS